MPCKSIGLDAGFAIPHLHSIRRGIIPGMQDAEPLPLRAAALRDALSQSGRAETPAFGPAVTDTSIPEGTGPGLFEFVVNIDTRASKIDVNTTKIDDDMMRLVFGRQKSPATITELLTILDGLDGQRSGLGEPRSFLVADGGQLPADVNVVREFRWALTRSRNGEVNVLISTSAEAEPASTFLQVMAWDRALFNLRSCGRSANRISLIRHTRPGQSRRRTGENRPRTAQVDNACRGRCRPGRRPATGSDDGR